MPGSEMPLMAGRSVEHAEHSVDRHVALDHVAVDQRRVAAHERLGHAVLAMQQGRSWVGFTVTSKPFSRR